MRELDWAYLAGFIDADGTISIRKNYKSGKTYSPQVSISNCDKSVLEWFKHLIGSGTICTKKAKKETYREGYDLRWSYNTALLICERCLPYLKIKQDRANILINDWKLCTPRNGKYTEEMWKRKLNLVKKIRKLNLRGPRK